MRILKGALVSSLLLGGAAILLRGLGGAIPLIRFHGLEGKNLPAGAFLMIIAVALAKYWRVESSGTESFEVYNRKGNLIKKTVKHYENKAKNPFGS